MKNNQKSIFILIPVLVIIWGIVAYQIFYSGDGEEVVKIKTKPLILQDDNLKAIDTFKLSLNYNDPFKLSRTKQSSSKKQITPKKTRKKDIKKEVLNWPTLKYNGMLLSSNKRSLALLTINGKDNLVKEGDTIEGIKIVSYDKNAIELKYKNELKTIMK